MCRCGSISRVWRPVSGAPARWLARRNCHDLRPSCAPILLSLNARLGVVRDILGHTRTAEATMDVQRLTGINKELLEKLKDSEIRIPLTQAVVYGWYDNEMGNYVYMLGELTRHIAES